MNFLDKLPKTQRDHLIRKVVALEGQAKPKPATQEELARDLLRRTLGRGKTHFKGEEKIDYTG